MRFCSSIHDCEMFCRGLICGFERAGKSEEECEAFKKEVAEMLKKERDFYRYCDNLWEELVKNGTIKVRKGFRYYCHKVVKFLKGE